MSVLRLLVCAIPAAAAVWGVDFNRDVRPILSDKCFVCHGPDAAAKRIPFRLDHEDQAKADLGGGRHAIVPANPEASTLVQRIRSSSPAKKMPPAYSGLKLSDAEIRTLETWVREGAQWEKHWSFIPPVSKAVPQVSKADWVRNPIDAFVLAHLERNNIEPSAEASREQLLRRVTLDITGLPPTPADIDAFLNDRSPGAYEKVVDRLLASPAYGERMAVRWLDGARYADTNGYQFDGERVMWRWRDWVINAFNKNEPYDQFTVEQIAGDLLPNATLDQKIATGFNRNHRANTEDGIVPEEYAVEYVVDRVETVSTVFLGVTLGCARCHNHKYDPFTQREFYQLFAYFNNIGESGRAMKYGNSPPLILAPTAEQQKQLADVERKIGAERSYLSQHEGEIANGQRRWELSLRQDSKSWTPRSGLTKSFHPGREFDFDGKNVVDGGGAGNFDIDQAFTLVARIYSDEVPDGSVLSRMTDSPQGKGYGLHMDHGKVHVNLTSVYADDSIRIESEETLEAKRWYQIAVAYDGSVTAAGIKVYVDGRPVRMKVLQENLYRPFKNAGRPFREPFRIGTGWGKDRRFRGRIDDVLLYDRTLPAEEIGAMAASPIRELAPIPSPNRTAAQASAIRWSYLEQADDAGIRGSWERLTGLLREKEAIEVKAPTVMVMQEKPGPPAQAHLLQRGAYDKPGEVVNRGVPATLPPLPAGVSNDRLALAKWMVNPDNPLTARVAVNRFWQLVFGTGLVKTVEDFGVQGEYPSNPDLLDWLATEFVRSGWDVKNLVRLMVTSATYRQRSAVTPELAQRDPDNRLLARGPRQRLPAEMVRDQALAAAGLLVTKIGGPSVKPYQPEGLWKDQAMQDMEYVRGTGADLYRRSLYTFWKRTIPPPMMINFDSAGRETCVVRETRTNTPLQALNLMNDVTFLEAARFIGQRMMKEGGETADSRLRFGFRLLTARFPSSEELNVLTDSLHYHLDYFKGEPSRSEALLKQGDSVSEPSLNRSQLAAYAAVASLMLNMDEVVTLQ